MTTYQLMYEFQKDLLFDNGVEKAADVARYRLHTKESLSDKAVEKHSATKEEQLAMLIDAAEQMLPHEVLYPEPGAVTEVDERTGRAVRSIWRETAQIYGGIQASELADRRREIPMMNSLISNLKKGIIWDEIGLGDQLDGVDALSAAYTRCEATVKDCEQIEASR